MAEKNPELDAAYAELEAAIRKANTLEGHKGVVTDWLVLGANQDFDDEGHPVTAVFRLVPPGEVMPFYRMLGLVDFAHAGMRNAITEESDDDD